jgi:hypothetical protein
MTAFSCPTNKRELVPGAGLFATIAVMLFSHCSVAMLCLNVLFDLFFFGLPVFLLHKMKILPTRMYLALTTAIINWTTPIVYGIPMVLSGSKVYCNDIDILLESKSNNSLLLANHGSRIDWMVGMFVGYATYLAETSCERIRVGFVCEALIQFMPLIGWYRKLVCQDIFVWRSFQVDAPTIKQNIEDFHSVDERRMLFLSPEGIVVDFGTKDMEYIHACRQFCIEQNYEPFDYVLTPRYKGSMSLLQQVEGCRGPVVSICVAYVRNGKLLNCSLLSPDRIVPDIITLNSGIGGSPVNIFIHLKRMNIAQDMKDPKTFMMENYKEKNHLLMEWDKQTKAGTSGSDEWMSKYSEITGSKSECIVHQLSHAALMICVALITDRIYTLVTTFCVLFGLVSGFHTLGLILNSTSMESVPFETGIKSMALYLQNRNSKKQGDKQS